MPNFELAVLYELSSQELFASNEALFADLKSKVTRIFAARRVMLEIADCKVFHWGFGQQRLSLDHCLVSSHAVYEKSLGQEQELGRFWLEKTESFKDFELRLLDIYCRQLERVLYAIKANQELVSANTRFREMVEHAPILAIHGFDGEGRILYWNRTAEKLYGFAKEEVLGQKVTSEQMGYALHRQFQQVLRNPPIVGEEQVWEGEVPNRLGQQKSVLSFVMPVGGSQQASEYMRMDVDISQNKRMEQELDFSSSHDQLTGLCNRNCFEQEMIRLEKSGDVCQGVIVCDLDGLKLINDTMGHQAGDALLIAAANILQRLFRSSDMVARVGGDEFAILLSTGGRTDVATAAGRIEEHVAHHNRTSPDLPLSLSVGFAVRETSVQRIRDLFIEADNNMSRKKLHLSQSNRSSVVQTLEKALEARDFITEGHADRLASMVVSVAQELGFPEHRLSDLRLLAKFHDIGKVGIKDQILFKPAKLSEEETVAMRQHCAIGYRIAQASPDLVPIADWIFKHHEWWDGSGYPLGLVGENIPLECRILAIADAFDAMVSDRPYRKGLSQEYAVEELYRCAGSQFDPELVPLFIQTVVYISRGKVLRFDGFKKAD
ncbi:MAG: diguanylate cyclase [Desulfuromonadaceae bacterium]|nr:diguanylate cyclase [Desulfuromonadaceae bacterium]